LALYHRTIKNAFNALFESATVGSETRTLWYINTNTIESNGFEAELNYHLQRVNLYANYSHVFYSKIDSFEGSSAGIDYDISKSFFGAGIFDGNQTLAGYPHRMLNLGIDYEPIDHLKLNLHYRVWDDIHYRAVLVSTDSVQYGPEHFVDFNLDYKNIAGTGFNIGFFVKNLLDNDEAQTPQLYFFNKWRPLGRSIGLKLSLGF
jgi:outer membrane receptor protein involved in Fe transport